MYFQKPPLGTSLDWENPLNKGLAMHLAMNEGHGDKVQDLSMNGNYGTISGMAFPPTVASGWNSGRSGVGLNFDGGNDYVSTPINNLFNDVFSLSFWVRPNDVDTNKYLFSGGLSTIKGVIIGYQDGYINFFDGAYPTGTAIDTQIPITAFEWQHVVMMSDTTKVYAYKNGIKIVEETGTWSHAGAINLLIGTGKTDSMFCNCSIDQPRVQNHLPTAKEVKDYYINPWQVYLD